MESEIYQITQSKNLNETDCQLESEEPLFEVSERDKEKDKVTYGLLGILDVIRMTNPDLNILALGTDLTTLELNLNSSECLFTNFISPWMNSHHMDTNPNISLPPCYKSSATTVKSFLMQKFSVETLFYIFYTMTRDMLQGYAAIELRNRGWLYHPKYIIWFTEDMSNCEAPSGTQYCFFDTESWVKAPCPPNLDLSELDPLNDLQGLVNKSIKAHSKWIEEQHKMLLMMQQQLKQQGQSSTNSNIASHPRSQGTGFNHQEEAAEKASLTVTIHNNKQTNYFLNSQQCVDTGYVTGQNNLPMSSVPQMQGQISSHSRMPQQLSGGLQLLKDGRKNEIGNNNSNS